MENQTMYTDSPPNELYHHGTKGQKWGKRLYQNKDGSLTPLGRLRYGSGNSDGKRTVKVSRKIQKQRAANLEKARQAKAEKKEAEKTEAETREQLLKSTNAKELYENRHLLTDAEIKARIDRIDLENRLNSKIVKEAEKTGLDHVNEFMKNSKDTLDNVTNLYKSVDNAYSTVANSAIGKTLAKQLGIDLPKKEKEFDLDDFMKNINKKSNKDVQDTTQRVANTIKLNQMQKQLSKENERKPEKKSDQDSKNQKKNDSDTGNDNKDKKDDSDTGNNNKDKQNDSNNKESSKTQNNKSDNTSTDYNEQILKNYKDMQKSTKQLDDGVDIVEDGRDYAEDLINRLNRQMNNTNSSKNDDDDDPIWDSTGFDKEWI